MKTTNYLKINMKRIILLFVVITALFACREDERGPMAGGGEAPMKVTNIQAKPIPGGAVITYDIPNNENLLYVRADYVLQTGEEKNVIASARVNSLTIEGLRTTDYCKVRIYSVSYNEVKSDVQEIEIQPLESPIESVFKTIDMEETFGGMKLTFKNATGAALKISVLTPDESGKMINVRDIYTKMIDGSFSVRNGKDNFLPEEREFGVCMRDRWNNKTDTIYFRGTPWEEYKLDRSTWSKVDLYDRNDPNAQVHTAAERPIGQAKNRDYTTNFTDQTSNCKFEFMWDNKYTTSGTSNSGSGQIFFSAYHGLPLNICLTLGYTATISRLVIHPKIGDMNKYVDAWGQSDPKVYEIWGCDETLDTERWDWDQWTLLRTVDMAEMKPSGLPYDADPKLCYTQEDKDMAYNGYEIEIPDCPPVKYLRINIKETWSPVAVAFQINEIFAYGVQK